MAEVEEGCRRPFSRVDRWNLNEARRGFRDKPSASSSPSICRSAACLSPDFPTIAPLSGVGSVFCAEDRASPMPEYSFFRFPLRGSFVVLQFGCGRVYPCGGKRGRRYAQLCCRGGPSAMNRNQKDWPITLYCMTGHNLSGKSLFEMR